MYPPTEPTQPEVDTAMPEPDPEQEQPNPLIPLSWTPEFLAKMFKEIEAAEGRRATVDKEWDICIKEYLPNVVEGGTPEAVKSNIHFRNIHTKLASVFYKFPEIVLESLRPLKDPISVNPLTGQPITPEDVVVIKREVLNKKLGSDGANISHTMDECLLDALGWSGIACAKIGYRGVQKDVQKPVMIPDPNFVPPMPPPGSVLGLQPPAQPPLIPLMVTNPETGQPEPKTQTVPVTIFEEWYIRRFSPKKLLFNADLTTSRIDEDACWIGQDLFLTGTQIEATYGFKPDSTPAATDDRLAGEKKPDANIEKKFHLYELWIRAAEYDPSQPHPQAIYQLVLMKDSREKPLVYRPCVDQTFDEEGKLTPDSLVGFPIEVMYLRDMPDDPYPKSDTAFTSSQVKQIDTHRRQSVRLRDAAIAKMLYDESAFTSEEIERLKGQKIGEWLAVGEGKLMNGVDKILANATQPVNGRDDYRLAALLKQDMEETLGIGAGTAGVIDNTNTKTATEVSEASNKGAARLGKDQQRATAFFLKCVRKFDIFLMRYATEIDYVQIAGQGGAKRLEMWNNKVISGVCAYNIKPDSQLSIDAARDYKQLMDFYKETSADPRVNVLPILKKLATLKGLDPVEVIQDPALAAAASQGVPVPIPGAPPPGPRPAPRPGPSGNAAGPGNPDRPHVETGGRPNAPQPGRPANTQQVP